MEKLVRQYMSTNIYHAMVHYSVKEVQENLARKSFHCLPILNEKMNLVGIITDKDILVSALDTDPIEKYMTKYTFKIEEDQPLQNAVQLMVDNRIHHLIVFKKKQLMGVLSSFDVMRSLLASTPD